MLAAIPFPDIGPDIVSFQIGGVTLALRWYAMAYIVGIVLGWRIAVHAVRRPVLWPAATPPMTPAQIEALVTWIILGVILGGRLGFVLFYQPGHYLANPRQIVMVWQGGMSFHGGMLGVAIALALFCRRHGIALPGALDVLALATPPGLLLGRIANFINGELWGRPTDLPWGVIFPGPQAQDCPGIEGLCARHPSQLYESTLEGLVLGVLVIYLAYRRGWLKAPGALTGVFLTGYGLARFAVEFVRQPDAQFTGPGNPLGLALHAGGYGLTMGQLLSLPMIALGLYLIGRARRVP